jgi:hypothetical protein
LRTALGCCDELQRNALTPCDFESLDTVAERLRGSQAEFTKTVARFAGRLPDATWLPCTPDRISAAGLTPAA